MHTRGSLGFTEEVSGRGPESLRGETGRWERGKRGGRGEGKPMETGGNGGDDAGAGRPVRQPQVVTIAAASKPDVL